MPGTVVRDALETDLLADCTLDSAGSTNGTAYEVGWVGEAQVVVETGTIDSGSGDETLEIVVQGCETSDFTTDDVVDLGRVSLVDTDDDSEFGIHVYIDSKYVRVVATAGGTTPDFSGTTAKLVQPHYHRVRGTSPTAAALA